MTNVGGISYYWLVFSSKRIANANQVKTTQLFLVAVAIDGAGSVKPAGAIKLWNLPENEDNHTPAWDLFKTQGPNSADADRKRIPKRKRKRIAKRKRIPKRTPIPKGIPKRTLKPTRKRAGS